MGLVAATRRPLIGEARPSWTMSRLGTLSGPLEGNGKRELVSKTRADQDPIATGESSKQGQTIVVVDDEVAVCSLLKEVLTSGGYNPVVTSDPRSALELVRRQKPVLVLADITMPDMDGYGLVAALQADAETCSCPVMFLTGHLTFSERLKAFRSGVRGYVTKPFTPEKILVSIARVLSDPQEPPPS